MNNISILGIVSRINKIDDKYIWFDICSHKTYKDKDGVSKTETSFFNAMISKSHSDKELIKVGNVIRISGIPKIYSDEKNDKHFYIHTLKIETKEKDQQPIISYDKDGTELWHGQRCESIPASPEEQAEMGKLLSKYDYSDIK